MFEIESRVRVIVADMLMNMNETLSITKRDVKQCQHDMIHFGTKMNEIKLMLEREAKMKELIDSLKQKIITLVRT